MEAPAMPDSQLANRQWAPAEIRAASWDEQSRTVDVVWSTGADVTRRDWSGAYVERLAMTSEAVDLSRLTAGAPVLNAHKSRDTGDVVGVVETAALKDGRGTATIRLSDRPEVAGLVSDVKSGVIRNVSVGYRVLEWKKTPAVEGRIEVREAVKWQPMELSLVPVPADQGAQIRKDPDMPENEAIETETRQWNAAARRDMAERYLTDDGEAAEFLRQHSRANERAFRDALLDHMADTSERSPTFPVVDTRGMQDTRAMQREAMAAALVHRANPSVELPDAAREFAHSSLLDMARTCVEAGGTSTRGWSPSEVVQRAFHTTSDFPTLLTESARRTLMPAYGSARSGLHRLARQASAKDFRPISRVNVTEDADLEQVNEHAEYKRGTFKEGKESYKIGTHGKIFGLSRQAIINDDLSAFTDVSTQLGRSAARFEDQFLTDLIESNPAMADGKAVFHADHGNLAAAGAAIDTDTLSAARLAMRKQVDPAGHRINVAAAFLLVAPDRETEAEKILAQIVAAKTDDVNTFAGKLELITNPYFEDPDSWFTVASPA
ncbi:MAG: Mu-like prophage major head subunit gpT family protein, partial [Novosphingobium sp.]|nr:Mu-like prophage major head subunit gpT family protein [Novosphingobium sp.]